MRLILEIWRYFRIVPRTINAQSWFVSWCHAISLLHILRSFDPHFLGLWRMCLDPCILEKMGKFRISTLTSCMYIDSTPGFDHLPPPILLFTDGKVVMFTTLNSLAAFEVVVVTPQVLSNEQKSSVWAPCFEGRIQDFILLRAQLFVHGRHGRGLEFGL